MFKITTEYNSKKVELFKSSKEKATELFKHVCELNNIDYHEDTTPEEWEKERPYFHTGNSDISVTLEYIQTINGKDIETALEALEIARGQMRILMNEDTSEAINEAARSEYKKFNDLIIKLS